MNRRTFWMVALGLAVLVVPASSSFAQERQNRDGAGGPGGGFEQFRERMMNELKERLAATPEEWQVLQPKIEKVSAARMATVGRGMFGRSSRGGSDRDRGGSDRPTSPVAKATRELDSALENKDTPADQIAAKLAAVREARAKAKTDLEAAQKDLKEVLTPRQEAVLVANGMLD